MKFVFFLIAALGHWFWVVWLMNRFPGLQSHKRAVYGIAFLLSAFSPLVRSLTPPSEPQALLLAGSAIELMTILLSAFALGLVIVVLKGWDRFFPAAEETERNVESAVESGEDDAQIRSGPVAEAPVTRREAIERVGGLLALAGTGSMLGWGMARGRHDFEIAEVVVRIPGLPKVLDGYTLAQISDVHVGIFVKERELREGLDLIRKVKPDLVVATGDLVDHDPAFIPLLARSLGALESRDGTVAILGNHDYYTDAARITDALRQAGLRVLVNDALHLRKEDGGGFALLGVDDFSGPRIDRTAGPRLDLAIAKAPPDRPRILLAHQPRFFDEAAGQIALQLSGHTHGGQINPGITPARLFMEFVHGRYERKGSSLWVNRGFGTAGPPSRVGAPPEVTKIVLVSA